MAEDYKLPYSGADIYRRLRDVDTKAVVKAMTTDEYEALEETNANTLYMLTDGDEGGNSGNSSNSNVTLLVSGWSGNEQTVSVSGVTATNTVIVGGDLGSEPIYTDCGVYCAEQGDGTLKFKCDTIPSGDVIANVAIL